MSTINTDHVMQACQSFRSRIEAITVAEDGYINSTIAPYMYQVLCQ